MRDNAAMSTPAAFRPLTGLYEPSAILQLPDGRLLVVEDEKRHPFSLVGIGADGRVDSAPLGPGWFESGEAFWKLDDLEGLALDRAGRVYAVTSHSRSGDGDDKRARNRLVRFRVEGDRALDRQVSEALKPALLAAHPALAEAAAVRDVKGDGGLNIEAMEFEADGPGLLVGLRSPLIDGCAVIARIADAEALFGDAEPPAVDLIALDLGGHGLRGLAWLPALGGYLAIAGPVGRAPGQFRLWFWSGRPDQAARRVEVPGLAGLEHAEGICPAVIDGRPRIVVVSDDGNRADGRYARYLLLDPDRLSIAD